MTLFDVRETLIERTIYEYYGNLWNSFIPLITAIQSPLSIEMKSMIYLEMGKRDFSAWM